MTAPKGNLLIIDDEVLILKKSKILLEDIADNIFTADNGFDALNILAKESINCIICDINMPGLSGIDVIREVRKNKNEIPFIFYTGHGSHDLMREAVKYGAFDFLDKPSLEGLEEVARRGLAVGLDNTAEADTEIFMSDYKKLIATLKEE